MRSASDGLRRVLVTGMGGQLGSLVAAELEKESWVGTIVGIDADPPRRRLSRSSFHLIEPSDAARTRAAEDSRVADAAAGPSRGGNVAIPAMHPEPADEAGSPVMPVD